MKKCYDAYECIQNTGEFKMKELRLKAFAKINLGLDVTKRRADGYHEVKMIMQTIGLFDQVILRQEPKGITIRTNLAYLPVNENNLAYKAAKLLMDEFKIEKGVLIEIKKHIPVAAGMAGGSTDAAAVLYGMNRMFHLKLNKQQLMERGLKLGADVPFCIARKTARAEGIGEILTKIPSMPECYLLIAKPPISVSTKYVYENLCLDEHTSHPDIDMIEQDLMKGNLEAMALHMGNLLESVTIKKYPIIAQIKQVMKQHNALNAMMSGSGPTVFGIFKDEESAKKALFDLKKQKLAKQLYITKPFYDKKVEKKTDKKRKDFENTKKKEERRYENG